jgi:hypothetical protein
MVKRKFKKRSIAMKEVSRGQALQVSARVGLEVKWDEIDGDALQHGIIELTPEEFGARFTAFLKNGGRFIFGDQKSFQAKPFNVEKFLGKGWKVDEQDERSIALAQIELSALQFETCLKEGESSIVGKEKLTRLKESGKILLGANAFFGLWEDYQTNKENSVLEWLWRNHKISYLDFFGTILRSPSGGRDVFYLYRRGRGEWHWGSHWLDRRWRAGDLSAVLAS